MPASPSLILKVLEHINDYANLPNSSSEWSKFTLRRSSADQISRLKLAQEVLNLFTLQGREDSTYQGKIIDFCAKRLPENSALRRHLEEAVRSHSQQKPPKHTGDANEGIAQVCEEINQQYEHLTGEEDSNPLIEDELIQTLQGTSLHSTFQNAELRMDVVDKVNDGIFVEEMIRTITIRQIEDRDSSASRDPLLNKTERSTSPATLLVAVRSRSSGESSRSDGSSFSVTSSTAGAKSEADRHTMG